MFDHKHYVPVLKGKRVEIPALVKLKSNAGVMPLLEAIPSKNADLVVESIKRHKWKSPYFHELRYFDKPGSGQAPLKDAVTGYAAAKAEGQHAIPVTGTGRSPSFQAAVKSHLDPAIGLAIRIYPEDFDDEEKLATALNNLIAYFGLDLDRVDLLLDQGSVPGTAAATLRQLFETNIAMLPHLTSWRTLTAISGSFPDGIGTLNQGWNRIQRVDWLAWASVIQRAKVARLPAFGDYAITHSRLPSTTRATVLAQLRYSTPDEFWVWKGKKANDFPGQFYKICADLVTRPQYCGATFSFGDSEIANSATNSGSPGNSETWRKIGLNHHFEKVVHQIANLP